MSEIPQFRIYGTDRPEIGEAIQPTLELRRWTELSNSERATIVREFRNRGWIAKYSNEILNTIGYINRRFLRLCPGKASRDPPRS